MNKFFKIGHYIFIEKPEKRPKSANYFIGIVIAMLPELPSSRCLVPACDGLYLRSACSHCEKNSMRPVRPGSATETY